MNTSMVDAAIQLAVAGWPVFPVSAATKRPLTPHGHLDATASPDGVRKMWNRLSGGVDTGIATPTGNGLLVIDIDPRNGGRIPQWAPKTLLVKTQSGGFHLYYKIDEDIKSRAGLFGPGVDSKCAGGYVLVPPSPGYHWVNTESRARVRAADLRARFQETHTGNGSAMRLPPEEWQRGIIHDQVVAWAAYFAGQLDDDQDVAMAVWAMVDQARAAGVRIDNARDHIGTAIRWVLRREASNGPSLS